MKHPWPAPTGVAGPYFSLEDSGDLRLPWCEACARHAWPPRWRCSCGGALSWKTAEGRGKLLAWSVVRRAVQPDMQNEVPYVVGFVALSAGVTVFTNIVNARPENMRAGLRVRSRIDLLEAQDGERAAVPVFEPEPNELSQP